MKTSQDDKCCDKTKPATEVRMGREVPAFKRASSCDSGKDAECTDKKEKKSENLASSLV
jgi:hypothetical protein